MYVAALLQTLNLPEIWGLDSDTDTGNSLLRYDSIIVG
jgi:hypothetical protein